MSKLSPIEKHQEVILIWNIVHLNTALDIIEEYKETEQ